MSKLSTVSDILAALKTTAKPETVEFKRMKYNVQAKNSLGNTQKEINNLLKGIDKNNELAIALFDSGVYEGRLLCGKMYKPKDLTSELMEAWVNTFENWEICDTFCMKLFSSSPLALEKIKAWSTREEEFVKRAAFATMASYGSRHKDEDNAVFLTFLPVIESASTDNRIYVKKAVNWALREIGKRNVDLKAEALNTANRILAKGDRASVWIAKDAIKELQHPSVSMRNYPRSLYPV